MEKVIIELGDELLELSEGQERAPLHPTRPRKLKRVANLAGQNGTRKDERLSREDASSKSGDSRLRLILFR